jgi:hypothetical protein
MTIPFLVKCLLVIIAVTITDIFWTLYISHSAALNKWKASFYASMIIIAGSFTTIEYVNDRRMIIPALIGAFIGTFIPLHLKEQKQKEEQND